MQPEQILVLGAGQAGASALIALRAAGFAGHLALVGDEPSLPYERPPLSKGVLLGESEPDDARIRDGAWYAENDIGLHLGSPAAMIDRASRTVVLADGAILPYDLLLIATGARARRLEGVEAANLHYLRDVSDAMRLRAMLRPGSRIGVLGAGFVGLEVAATARRLGCEVLVCEVGPRALSRSAPEEVARFLVRRHEDHGVTFSFGCRPDLEIRNGRVVALVTAGGMRYPVDAVVAGLGAIPNTELAESAGLAVDDGLLVDAYGRTDDPAIFAAGDVTRHVNPLLGRSLRLESWQNASNQGAAVAENMLGAGKPFAEIPWLWSDQFDVNLQICGAPVRWDRVIRRPGASEAAFTAFQICGDHVVGAVCVNAGRDMRFARKIVERGRLGVDGPGLEALADPSHRLQAFTG